MKSDEFNKIKTKLAIKASSMIFLCTILGIIILTFLVDVVYNDYLAEYLYSINKEFYHFCVANKTLVMFGCYTFIFIIVSFIVIRNSNNNMVKVISAMDQILKEPSKEIDLPNDLMILENRLNNIRIDLITSQNDAKEAMTKKNDLIMYMAHDLKTPLTSIIGYLTLLTDEKEIPKNLQEKYLKIALDKSLRVEELTNQFFDITRYNLNAMPITKQNINLSFLIEQLIEESYPMLQDKNLECKLDKTQTIMFLGDGDKLARAFGNLLKNAISYSYENTTIEISMKESDDKINIVFRNKGDKIPDYKLEKIFEKFYRGSEARTSNTGGVGLGLAITREIIELHGGKIYAKNDNDYIEFYIELDRKDNI